MTEETIINNCIVRIRKPGNHIVPVAVIILLHGWTGDEKAMWVFAEQFPKDHLLVAHRGIFPAHSRGYGWHDGPVRAYPSVCDFKSSIKLINQLLGTLRQMTKCPDDVILVGFSEGAALAYSYTIQFPGSITKIAALSGFVPEGIQVYFDAKPFSGKKVFVTHGIKDKLVPIERAREDREKLIELGAEIDYCEADVGHKLSVGCFKLLEKFIAQSNPCALRSATSMESPCGVGLCSPLLSQ